MSSVGFSQEKSIEEERSVSYKHLDWKDSGIHKLSNSQSTISLPEGYKVITGESAKKSRELLGEFNKTSTEAIIHDTNFQNRILFEYHDSGHVSLDDWKDLDPKVLLESFIQNTEEANVERQSKGFETLQVLGWVQEPVLDKETNTVFWAIKGKVTNESTPLVNAVALKLSRCGYERICWVTTLDSFKPFDGHLDIMLRSHSFNEGARYSDYKSGDKLAGYGIAALVAATVGGKIVKAGWLILLFKKVGGLIVAGIIIFFNKIKGLFKKGSISA